MIGSAWGISNGGILVRVIDVFSVTGRGGSSLSVCTGVMLLSRGDVVGWREWFREEAELCLGDLGVYAV